MKRLVIHIFVILLITRPVWSANDGGTDSPFNLGVGARDISMGGANMANCEITTAPYWNASRMARAEYLTFSGFHVNLFESDVAYQYLGIVLPTMDFGVFGIGINRLGVGGIEKRDNNNVLIGEIKESRLALSMAYARTISNYDVGLVLNMEYQSLDNLSATSSPGFNISISRQFDFHMNRWQYLMISMNSRNLIRPKIKLANESYTYPFGLDIGMSLGISSFSNWDQAGIVSLGMTKNDMAEVRINTGFEYSFSKILFVRGGIKEANYSFGAGLKFREIAFDYAMVEQDLGYLHMFSLVSNFGASVEHKREARIKKRETEFNKTMEDQIISRNRQMIGTLIENGDISFEMGDLIGAGNSYDRALFLSRATDYDTTEIALKAAQIEELLVQQTRNAKYQQYLDSAQVKVNAGDMLLAKHFAKLALEEDPNSIIAKEIINKVDEQINLMASQTEYIQHQLKAADSLLSYSRYNEAISILENLEQLDQDNVLIKQNIKKARFDSYRDYAQKAFNGNDLTISSIYLDSALMLFPHNSGCNELKERIVSLSVQEIIVETDDAEIVIKPLSSDLKKEVEEEYNNAQEYYKNGELNRAVESWERVERLAPDYQSVRKYLINAYKYIGVDLYGNNNLKEALKTWQKAALLDENNSEINNYIRRAETEIKKLQELSYEHE